MTQLVHQIFTPQAPPPAPLSIYDEIIDIVETAEYADGRGDATGALILLSRAKDRLTSYLASMAH